MTTSIRVLTIAALVLAVTAPIQAAATAAPAARAATCPAGAEVIKAESVQVQPDGSRVVGYAGGTTIVRQPPAGFDPRRATAAQLRAFQLPARPAAGSATARSWTDFAARLRPDRAEHMCRFPHVTSRPASPVGAPGGGYWAGKINTSHTYDAAQGDIVEPSTATTPCTRQNDVVNWVGLGGYGSSKLVQAGTWSAGNGGDYVWHESLPSEPSLITQGTVSAGDRIHMRVSYAYPYFSWSFADYTTGQSWSGTAYKPNDYYGGTAEHITERPLYSGVPAQLRRFNPGAVVWTSSNSHITGGSYILLNGPYISVDMIDGNGQLLARSEAPLAADSFKDTWVRCGE